MSFKPPSTWSILTMPTLIDTGYASVRQIADELSDSLTGSLSELVYTSQYLGELWNSEGNHYASARCKLTSTVEISSLEGGVADDSYTKRLFLTKYTAVPMALR